jgi:hypothetical protein
LSTFDLKNKPPEEKEEEAESLLHSAESKELALKLESKAKLASFLTKLCVGAAILAPLLFCIFYVSRYAVNTPYRDDYHVLICLKKLIDGQMNPLDVLFVQHNEHRVGLPYLLLLSSFPITHYNTALQVYLGIAFLIGSGLLVMEKAWQEFKTIGVPALALIPFAWLIFTPRQTLNLLFDIQVLLFMSVFFFIASLRLLEGANTIGPRLGGALLAAFGSAFSCANGLLTLPLGTLLLGLKLWSDSARSITQKLAVLSTWIFGCAVIGALYFHNFIRIASHEPRSLSWLVEQKENLFKFFLAFLASPIANESLAAISVGLVFVVITGATGVLLWTNRKSVKADSLFPIMLILYAVISAALASFGRVQLGLEAAYTSRYAGIANYGWVGLYMLLVFSRRLNHNVFTLLTGGIISCLLLGTTTTYLIQRDQALSFHNTALEAQNVARTFRYQGPVALRAMTGGFDYDYIRSLLAFMEKEKISVFQKALPSIAQLTNYGDSPYWITADRINGEIFNGGTIPIISLDRSKQNELTIQGWSGDVKSGQTTPSVLLTIDDNLNIQAASGLERTDIVQATGKRSLLLCGFKGSFSTISLSKGAHVISAKILSPDGKGYFRSRPLLKLDLL